MLSLLGTGALALGALLLFRAPGGELLPVPGFSLYLVLGGLAVFFALALRGVWRVHRRVPSSGAEDMAGTPARVVVALNPEGMVQHRGELWKARLRGEGFVHVGETVRVLEVRGLLLEVEPWDGELEEGKEEDP